MRLHGRNLRIIVPVRPVMHRVSCGNDMVPNAPKHYKMHQIMCLWSNGVDRLCSLRITPTRLIGRPFALIALYWPILDQLSCCNEMIESVPNRYETNKNMSLGSNGVYRVRSLRKFQTRLCGTNFCINCTGSARFAPSFVQ